MAKKKSVKERRKRQREYLNLKKQGKVAFDLAYGLCTSSPDSCGAKAAKQLLLLRRKELPGESLPSCGGILAKYRKLMMDGGEAFDSLCLVLLAAMDDDRLKDKVARVLFDCFAQDIMHQLADSYTRHGGPRPGDAIDVDSLARLASRDRQESATLIGRLLASWAGLPDYIDALGVNLIIDGDKFEDLTGIGLGAQFGEVELPLDALRYSLTDDGSSDSDILRGYRNGSWYYSVMRDIVPKALLEIVGKDFLYDKRLEYDNVFELWKASSRLNKKHYDIAKQHLSSGATMLKAEFPKGDSEDPLFGALDMETKSEVIREYDPPIIWFVTAVSAIRAEFLAWGIDIFSIARRVNLSVKDIHKALDKAFVLYDVQYAAFNNGDECMYEKSSDQEALAAVVARVWAAAVISKAADSLLDEKRLNKKEKGESAELSAAMDLVDELRDEIASLQAKSGMKSDESVELKEKNSQIKELRAKLHEVESALAKAEEREENALQENKELRGILDIESACGDEESIEDVTGENLVSEEFFNDYIKKHKVLVWGLRSSTEQKYADMYPELSFATSDRKITRQQLKNYEVLIMCTSHTSHAQFWNARDTAKALGIKMSYLAKNMNDPKHLWWALGVAIGAEAES